MRNIWNIPGLPHTGWHCLSVTELEAPDHTCEMCRKEDIRFVHNLSHPQGIFLQVGCVCSGKLTGDLTLMVKMNADAKKLANQKKTWFNKDWQTIGPIYIEKSTKTFEAYIGKKSNKTWRYSYNVKHVPSGKKFAGKSMIKQNAIDSIEAWISKFV